MPGCRVSLAPLLHLPRAVGWNVPICVPVFVCLLLFPACGKKGPLELPDDLRPAAIDDLRAESEDARIRLSWSRPEWNVDGSRFRDLAGFVILRAEDDQSAFRKVFYLEFPGAGAEADRPSWVDPDTVAGHAYRYRVSSMNSLHVLSLPSNTASSRSVHGLPAPTGLAGTGGDGFAQLTWDPVPGAVGYHVYRGRRMEGPFERLTDPMLSSPVFRDLIRNTDTFAYRVRAVGEGSSLGAISETILIQPHRSTMPESIRGLKAVYVPGKVYLTWAPAMDTTSLGAYEVCRSVSTGDRRCVRTYQPSFTDSNVREGQEILYEVRCVDDSASPVRGEAASILVETRSSGEP